MTPAGKGQNEFYFTFIEAQINIRNSFLVCKQGQLRTFGLHGFLLGSETRLSANTPERCLSRVRVFHGNVCLHGEQTAGCWGRLCWDVWGGRGRSGMLRLCRSWVPPGMCTGQWGGGKEPQERSVSSAQSGRRGPAEVVTDLTEDKGEQS